MDDRESQENGNLLKGIYVCHLSYFIFQLCPIGQALAYGVRDCKFDSHCCLILY